MKEYIDLYPWGEQTNEKQKLNPIRDGIIKQKTCE